MESSQPFKSGRPVLLNCLVPNGLMSLLEKKVTQEKRSRSEIVRELLKKGLKYE